MYQFVSEGIQNSKDQKFFPYECFGQPNKMKNTELSPFDVYSKSCSCDPFHTEYNDNVNLLKKAMTA